MSEEQTPNVQFEEPEPGLKVFSVEVPEASLHAEMEKAYGDLARDARVPGFRKGKIPRSVLERRYAGAIRSDALEKLVSRVVWRTLDSYEVTPFFDPEVEDLSADEGEPVRFRIRIDAWPAIELKQYKDFELDRPVRPVSDEEVAEALERIREGNPEYVRAERPAIRTDQLIFHYQRFLENGNAFGKRVTGAEVILRPEPSEDAVQKTLEEGMLGLSPGETKGIPVDFPVDYPNAALAGKVVEFRIELDEVRERMLPAVDDAFAGRILGEEGAGVDDLRAKIREEMTKKAEEEADEALDRDILERIIEANPIDVPERLLDKVAEKNAPSFPSEEEIPPEHREEAARQKAEYLAEQRKGALRAIQKLALLSEISRRENLEPKEQEVQAMKRVFRPRTDPSLSAERRRRDEEDLEKDIRRLLRERKVYQWVREHSTVKP
ncbi:MAG: trigger factor [Candidatus Eisenbacteria bacterium]|nr:trigger factor [Candidatus Eisenbacteria bacterium]